MERCREQKERLAYGLCYEK
jgi:hypothetical protein